MGRGGCRAGLGGRPKLMSAPAPAAPAEPTPAGQQSVAFVGERPAEPAPGWPGSMGLPPPPAMPAPALMQAQQMQAAPVEAQQQAVPAQQQAMPAQSQPQAMPAQQQQPVHHHLAPITAVPPHMSAASTAAVAPSQSSLYVMQQAVSLPPSDIMKVYEGLKKHLHSEGLLRGMSVSARNKRRVKCLKETCPGHAMTASKKQATCKDGNNCGYHAQFACTVCEEGKRDFKRCTC